MPFASLAYSRQCHSSQPAVSSSMSIRRTGSVASHRFSNHLGGSPPIRPCGVMTLFLNRLPIAQSNLGNDQLSREVVLRLAHTHHDTRFGKLRGVYRIVDQIGR